MSTGVLPRMLMLALMSCATSRAGDLDMVEVRVQFLRATEAQARTLLVPDFPPPQIGGPAAPGGTLDLAGVFPIAQSEKILQKFKEAGAEVISSQKMATVSGHRLTVRNVRELSYPSEYSEEKDGTLPTAFENKDVGITLDLTPTSAPEETISLEFSLQVTEFEGFIDVSQVKPGTDPASPEMRKKLLKAPLNRGGIWQPVFDARNLTTEITVHSGQTWIIRGLPTRQEPEAKQTYIFITARLVPTP